MAIITMNTVRKSGHCISGVRKICQEHGIDMRRLAKDGIPADEVRHIENAYVQQMIQIAEEEE